MSSNTLVITMAHKRVTSFSPLNLLSGIQIDYGTLITTQAFCSGSPFTVRQSIQNLVSIDFICLSPRPPTNIATAKMRAFSALLMVITHIFIISSATIYQSIPTTDITFPGYDSSFSQNCFNANTTAATTPFPPADKNTLASILIPLTQAGTQVIPQTSTVGCHRLYCQASSAVWLCRNVSPRP